MTTIDHRLDALRYSYQADLYREIIPKSGKLIMCSTPRSGKTLYQKMFMEESLRQKKSHVDIILGLAGHRLTSNQIADLNMKQQEIDKLAKTIKEATMHSIDGMNVNCGREITPEERIEKLEKQLAEAKAAKVEADKPVKASKINIGINKLGSGYQIDTEPHGYSNDCLHAMSTKPQVIKFVTKMIEEME
jgi:hypothetical protein